MREIRNDGGGGAKMTEPSVADGRAHLPSTSGDSTLVTWR